jgi:hypothetical protein
MLYSMCAWTDSAGLGSPISPDGPSHLEDLRKQHKAWVPPSAAGRKTYVRMDPVGVWISTDSESLSSRSPIRIWNRVPKKTAMRGASDHVSLKYHALGYSQSAGIVRWRVRARRPSPLHTNVSRKTPTFLILAYAILSSSDRPVMISTLRPWLQFSKKRSTSSTASYER